MASHPVTLDGKTLSIADVHAIAHGAGVAIDDTVWPAVEASRKVVDDLVARGEVAYGITTGFGEFAHVTIEPGQVQALQRNLIMSHSVGVGDPLGRHIVRAMMAIRINTLIQGASGVRRVLVERIAALLNADCIPVVPSRGSVGASGDLAPLAHMALPIIGLGRVDLAGQTMDAAAALGRLGLDPLTLEAKEGLALINGTQLMSAMGSLAVHEARALMQDAQVAAAMSVEALMGSIHPFEARIHALRPHVGQGVVAANMRGLMAGSRIVESHIGCGRVQDAYSLRCIPQVLGACRDVIEQAAGTMDREINSVTDNPLVFSDGSIVSQGNFHGEPLAFALDALAMALAEVASISERRVERLVNPDLSEGLKPFLVDNGGLNSGYMIAQYVAAALVSENKVHAHPASVDSIPTSANQEDHVSMGSISALKLAQVLHNARRVVAIEALCAAQALDFKADEGLQPGVGAAAGRSAVRGVVARLVEDRVLSDDVQAVEAFLQRDGLRAAAARAGVELQ